MTKGLFVLDKSSDSLAREDWRNDMLSTNKKELKLMVLKFSVLKGRTCKFFIPSLFFLERYQQDSLRIVLDKRPQ